uniref:Uncharacterized protein n=1 Tax=Oryza punctata TaxID=4537 RepID=A0A0E0KIL0_ORYPU
MDYSHHPNAGQCSLVQPCLVTCLLLLFLLLSPPALPCSASSSVITRLPGFHGRLPFYLETGYIGVEEETGTELFYYFVESESNPDTDPLLLWLVGGPRCSVFCAFSYEVGPINFVLEPYNGSLPRLIYNPYSWTQMASIIFLDTPVGSGFSYARDSKGYDVGDISSSFQVVTFLKEWFNDHPRYRSHNFYLGGSSYAGKGYIVGNPVTDSQFDKNFLVPYSHGLGIISDQLYEAAVSHCKGDYVNPTDQLCVNVLSTIDKSYPYYLSYYWMNDNMTRDGLKIRKGTVDEWIRCYRGALPYAKDITSIFDYHFNLTTRGYRALVMSGDHDLVVPFLSTQAWIRSFNFSIVDGWRAWHGGAHVPASNRPKQAFAMGQRSSSCQSTNKLLTMGTHRVGRRCMLLQPPRLATCLLFLLLPLSCSASSVITHLPGFHGRLPFHLETGYVGVDEETGTELFYYFVESERSPSTDPVILWLTGGPGCSAFSGVVYEVGPMKYVLEPYNGSLPRLVYNQYSWTQMASILFLDTPVGSGFSYAHDPKGYNVGDRSSSLQVVTFLKKWFNDHPRYLSNHFYVGGSSYAGKGYIVGNPLTGSKIDGNFKVPYSHGVGIISDQLYEAAVANCNGDYVSTTNELCAKALNAIDNLMSEVDDGNILDDKCVLATPKPINDVSGSRSLLEDYIRLREPTSYRYYLSFLWMNNNMTREALKIKKGTVGEWIRCKQGLPYVKDVASSIKYHFDLTTRGYRALVFRFTILYANNLTFATVKGGGHTSIETNPKQGFAMGKRWLDNKPLPDPSLLPFLAQSESGHRELRGARPDLVLERRRLEQRHRRGKDILADN